MLAKAGLHQLPKEGPVPALRVRSMAMWTTGTTEQEAQVEHRQPHLEASLHSEITELLLAFPARDVLDALSAEHSILEEQQEVRRSQMSVGSAPQVTAWYGTGWAHLPLAASDQSHIC